MTTREKLMEEARKGVELRSSELASRWGVSRQTVSGHLRRLVEEGVLEKSGSTKNATYVLTGVVATDTDVPARETAVEPVAEPVASSVKRSPTWRERRRWSGATLASTALGMLVVVVLVLRVGSDQRRAPGATTIEPAQATATSSIGSAGDALDRAQTIGADRQLALANMNVVAGTEVTLQAGEMVALGDGFSVDRNAALVVKIEDPRQP